MIFKEQEKSLTKVIPVFYSRRVLHTNTNCENDIEKAKVFRIMCVFQQNLYLVKLRTDITMFFIMNKVVYIDISLYCTYISIKLSACVKNIKLHGLNSHALHFFFQKVTT